MQTMQSTATGRQPRVSVLEGRKHFVCPVVMMKVGVWNGSRGPLLYTANDLAASAKPWNGKPVVIAHPSLNTGGCAGHPDVFNRQKVGHVFSARFDAAAQALKCEAWIDPERLAAVSPHVLRAVQAGAPLEVSTGLWTDDEQTFGRWQGKDYHAIARNHRPDHLAILPDERGSCSLKDGAGLNVNRLAAPTPAPSLMLNRYNQPNRVTDYMEPPLVAPCLNQYFTTRRR